MEAQETFFAEVADRFTSDVTIHFLEALQAEFGEKPHVVLDNAAYFALNQTAEYVEESKLKVTYLPTGSPDMNPVEECWRLLKRSLGTRFFQSRNELRMEAFDAVEVVSPPQLIDHFCPSE